MSSAHLAQESVRAILQAKEQQDLRDFNTIVAKGELNKNSYAVIDIYDCNRIPLLKTKISTPAVASKAYDTFAFCRDWGLEEPDLLKSNSVSQIGSAEVKSALGGAYRALSIRQETSRVIKTAKEREDENDRLARVLQYMTDAKTIIDQSRLYFEAAVNFQDMEMYERASYCYKKATKRANAALVVDTYDLPEDEKFRRHVERMSKFQLPQFMQRRMELRNNLIFAEEERQRLRARESHFQLARIHLLTDLVDLPLAHNNVRLAFKNCSNAEEHKDMLLSMHVLMKEFAGLRRREIPLIKQIERGTQGPIADAHLNILLELEALFPNNADVQEWLGIRYTEKCDLEAAQFHFKRLRDILEPARDMADTLLVWGNTFKIPVTSADDPIQQAIDAEIRANICKTPVGMITLEGEVPQRATMSSAERAIEEMAQQLKLRQDRRQNQARTGASTAAGLGEVERRTNGAGTGNGAINSGTNSAVLSGSISAATSRLPSAAGRGDPSLSAAGAQTRRPSFQADSAIAAPPAPQEERRDLAWFGGKHTDCNTIIYKAPLQGWNTLLPTSYAGSQPTPARKKR